MAKSTNVSQKTEDDTMTSSLKQADETVVDIEDMPLETLRDYRLYNERALKLNKKLRECRYKIKQCPVELHPHTRIRFGNNDKSMHPVKVFLSNHLIHYDKKLTPGTIVDVPECIAHYLSEKGYPQYERYTNRDGSSDTRMVGKSPRFSVTTVWKDS